MGFRLRRWLFLGSSLLPAIVPGELAAAYRWTVEPMGGTQASFERFQPFRFTLKTDTAFQGTLRMGQTGNAFSVVFPLSVGPGEFQIELPGFTQSNQYNSGEFPVRLVDHTSGTVEKKEFSFVGHLNTSLQGQTINWVGPRKAGFTSGSVSQAMVMTLRINRIEPSEVPSDPLLWECADSWIIPGQFIPDLTPQQLQGLREYVRRGGRVRLDTSGSDEAWSAHPFLTGLSLKRNDEAIARTLPVQATVWDPSLDPKTIQQLQSNPANRTSDQVAHKKMEVPVTWRGLSHKGVPVSLESPWRTGWVDGLGWMDVYAFDMEAFRKEHEASEYMQAFPVLLIGQENHDHFAKNPSKNMRHYGYNSVMSTGAQQLKDWTNLKPIPAALVFIFLCLFVVLIGPVEQVFMRKRKWTSFTWGTSLILVLVFSLSAALISRLVRGTDCRQTSVTYRDYLPEGGGVDTFTDQFTPSRFRRFTADAGEEALWTPAIRSNNYWWYNRERAGQATLNWSSRSLQVEAPVWATTKHGGRATHRLPPPFRRDGESIVTAEAMAGVYSRKGYQIFEWQGNQDGSVWSAPRKLTKKETQAYLKHRSHRTDSVDPDIKDDENRGTDWVLTALLHHPDDVSGSWRRAFLAGFLGHTGLPPLLPAGADDHELVIGWQLDDPRPSWDYQKVQQRGLLLHRHILPHIPAPSGDAS